MIRMMLRELKPQFLVSVVRVEDYQVVDGVWDPDQKDYIVADGRYWRDAGSPTVTKTGPREYLTPVKSIAEAQLISFLCPTCFIANGGPVGTHHLRMPIAGRGLATDRYPHQWDISGTGFDDVTSNPSFLVMGGCGAHFHLRNGAIDLV